MKLKSLFISSFFSGIFLTACDSSKDVKETDVPQSVVAAFKAKYPNATVTEWETEKEDGKIIYEAKFKEGDKEKKVHVAADGSSVSDDD